MEIWNGDNPGQPPDLIPLIGRRVSKAWLLPSSQTLATLAVRFEGGKFLTVEAVESVGDVAALAVKVGDERPGVDWSDLDVLEQTPHLIALRGKLLSGLFANVLAFGDVGVQISKAGVRWVKRAR